MKAKCHIWNQVEHTNDQSQTKSQTNVYCQLYAQAVSVLTCNIGSVPMYVFVFVGITQDRIDECRGAKEAAMLADIRALVQSGADLNAQDANGTTLVR